MSRVLHIGKFYPPFAGGIENFLADLLPAQAQAGDTALALVHDHRWPGWRLWPRVAADAEYPEVYRAPCFGRLLYAPVSPHYPFWLGRLIADFRPDLLHLHMPNTSAFWALFSPRARRLPWVVHWHADVVDPGAQWDKRLPLAYYAYRPFEQKLLEKAQAVIVTSPPYLESSMPLRPWRDKCRVIPLGLEGRRLPEPDTDALAWAERTWGVSARLRVLSVGRMTYYKGHRFLLRALAENDDLQALIVGHGELQPHLQRDIDTLGLEARARLLGFRSPAELVALFATCDVFCLPSLERTEAFGVVLLEAMRYGKPLVASAIPGSGVAWVVQDGQTGLLVPPADPHELARALLKLAGDPALRAKLGQAGARRFWEVFQIRQVAEAIAALYRELGASGKA